MAASELTGNPARAKLADYTLALARAQLREHGIRRPPDREALLAAYLDWQRAPEPEPRLCACGCGQPIQTGPHRLPPARPPGQPRRWVADEARRAEEIQAGGSR